MGAPTSTASVIKRLKVRVSDGTMPPPGDRGSVHDHDTVGPVKSGTALFRGLQDLDVRGVTSWLDRAVVHFEQQRLSMSFGSGPTSVNGDAE